uniref:Uncharacterized protein n=1 Tax=Anguilla anguilla TaxID=7936 RepID=A0A0E9UD41_ANGAN
MAIYTSSVQLGKFTPQDGISNNTVRSSRGLSREY